MAQIKPINHIHPELRVFLQEREEMGVCEFLETFHVQLSKYLREIKPILTPYSRIFTVFLERVTFNCPFEADLFTMVKKKVDSRIRKLIEEDVRKRHRSLFVIIGDHGRDQVVNLHYMLSRAPGMIKRPSVLWCYKQELGFSSHQQKKIRKIKHRKSLLSSMAHGGDVSSFSNTFELFISATEIRYCKYSKSDSILGNTYSILVLQDFEALTPNILARTIETVEGGGIIVLLLKTLSSLRQLYQLTMDVHSRFRTEAHQEVVARFNERFILSLADCTTSLVVDDELNVLPISNNSFFMLQEPEDDQQNGFKTEEESQELQTLKLSLAETQPVGSLIGPAKTLDQAKAILTFIESISEKSLRSIVTLIAARGRGKSAAMGIAVAAAVAYGYSNIFVTSPSPENLKTFFDFVLKGFDALQYQEHLDYNIQQSIPGTTKKPIIMRIDIHRQHRQTIQYINPQDTQLLGHAELLVIDEAAAIPLALVKKLLGPYLVFMASTVNGYEGTGRSLSLKLIEQLRGYGNHMPKTNEQLLCKTESLKAGYGSHRLQEIKLDQPIRYATNDPVERWLNKLLCLDASILPRSLTGCPHPDQCQLYFVDRDSLFSYHETSESFLQRMMALYVASHYKNSPNDLQLMSDAPAHCLFVLLPPVDESTSSIPEILCVLQVALEGEISRQSVIQALARKDRPSGDIIPWVISQQFQDMNFGGLSGGRIVRIATHPDYQGMGYGTRALQLLYSYFQGHFVSLSNEDSFKHSDNITIAGDEYPKPDSLLTETLGPRKNLPPLLRRLDENPLQSLHYLGVSYGLTPSLYKFWKRAGYVPLYISQSKSEITGEHTCIMLKSLETNPIKDQDDSDWIHLFHTDFRGRFASLLGYQFRDFHPSLSLDIIQTKLATGDNSKISLEKEMSRQELVLYMSPFDRKRIDAYANGFCEQHVITDLLPIMARHVLLGKLKIELNFVQAAILLCRGLQHKEIDEIEREISLHPSQILALLLKCIKKISDAYNIIEKSSIEKDLLQDNQKNGAGRLKPFLSQQEENTSHDHLGSNRGTLIHDEQYRMLESVDLSRYAIGGNDEEWQSALKNHKRTSSISVLNSQKGENSQPSSRANKKLKPKFEKARH